MSELLTALRELSLQLQEDATFLCEDRHRLASSFERIAQLAHVRTAELQGKQEEVFRLRSVLSATTRGLPHAGLWWREEEERILSGVEETVQQLEERMRGAEKVAERESLPGKANEISCSLLAIAAGVDAIDLLLRRALSAAVGGGDTTGLTSCSLCSWEEDGIDDAEDGAAGGQGQGGGRGGGG
eukprot:762880-Hanusia_phi.AAC.2